MTFTIRLRSGKELVYNHPVVMGIINVTPDSFFSGSRTLLSADKEEAEKLLRARVNDMVQAGAEMIDVGACSTRPGYTPPSAEEELNRLEWGLPIVISALQDTPLPISVDTYRASVAEAAITRLGADIINDVYGGTRDKEMFSVVSRTGAPYILTADSNDVSGFFRQQIAALRPSPFSLILDPGFGFSKTLEENYQIMKQLPELIEEFKEYPMLIGISRKSMIFRLLGTDPEHSLNGTTVLNTFAIQAGSHILRVHDVREAVECVKILSSIHA